MTPDADWFKSMYQQVEATPPPTRDVGRVLTMHRNGHEAALDLRILPAWGHELLLSIDGVWQRTRVFRRHQPLELMDAIAMIEAGLVDRGWEAR